MVRVLILHIEAGHGHRKAAEAIAEEFKTNHASEVQVEIFDALQKTNRLFKSSYAQIYQKMVFWAPWLWGFFYYFIDLPLIYPLLAPFRSLWNRFQAKELRDYLIKEQFDFIVVTHFMPAEVSAALKKKGLIKSKLITVVTDVYPHSVWVNPGADFYWVLASESSEDLVKKRVPKNAIFAGGIPVSSKFTTPLEKKSLREKFALKHDRLTLLFTSGSFGVGPTEQILDSLEPLGTKIQVLIVCGRNEQLFNGLSARRFSFPVFLFGFVDNMHELMTVSDLMIAKPGGITMCESLVKGVPTIIMAPIPGQEMYNAKWLLKRGAAFGVKGILEIKDLVQQLTDDPAFFDSTRRVIGQMAKPNAARDIVAFVLKGKTP